MPLVAAAHAAGNLGSRQVRMLTDTFGLSPDRFSDWEATLVELAGRLEAGEYQIRGPVAEPTFLQPGGQPLLARPPP